jgi:hypothetical protein
MARRRGRSFSRKSRRLRRARAGVPAARASDRRSRWRSPPPRRAPPRGSGTRRGRGRGSVEPAVVPTPPRFAPTARAPPRDEGPGRGRAAPCRALRSRRRSSGPAPPSGSGPTRARVPLR